MSRLASSARRRISAGQERSRTATTQHQADNAEHQADTIFAKQLAQEAALGFGMESREERSMAEGIRREAARTRKTHLAQIRLIAEHEGIAGIEYEAGSPWLRRDHPLGNAQQRSPGPVREHHLANDLGIHTPVVGSAVQHGKR